MFRRIALSWTRFRASWRKFLHVGKIEEEIADELRFHLQREIETNVKAGMTPEEVPLRRFTEFRWGGTDQGAMSGRWKDQIH
jgi:hypothetical protein